MVQTIGAYCILGLMPILHQVKPTIARNADKIDHTSEKSQPRGVRIDLVSHS